MIIQAPHFSLLQAEFERRCREPSDINEHLPALWQLARHCTAICEFGVRTGNSTFAFLAGLEANVTAVASKELHSYDIEEPQMPAPVLKHDLSWSFRKRDTAHLGTIPLCDLLFIDTAHTAVHVTAELQYHKQVAKYIVFHDTILWGIIGMDGKPGVLDAAMRFLAANPAWKVHSHAANNNGLLVLERRGIE